MRRHVKREIRLQVHHCLCLLKCNSTSCSWAKIIELLGGVLFTRIGNQINFVLNLLYQSFFLFRESRFSLFWSFRCLTSWSIFEEILHSIKLIKNLQPFTKFFVVLANDNFFFRTELHFPKIFSADFNRSVKTYGHVERSGTLWTSVRLFSSVMFHVSTIKRLPREFLAANVASHFLCSLHKDQALMTLNLLFST